MKIYIRYMVSLRCKMLVREKLKKLGLGQAAIDFGVVEIMGSMSDAQHAQLTTDLHRSGMVMLSKEQGSLIETMGQVIFDLIRNPTVLADAVLEQYIAEKTGAGYALTAKLFAEVKGQSVEVYIMAEKIEYAKELIIYEGLSLKEIAAKLQYRNIALLTQQFKKISGLSPAYFRQIQRKRKSLTGKK
jgi:YesN/AraC family two-component response regulator